MVRLQSTRPPEKAHHFTITDPDEYEGIGIVPISPLHRAVLKEGGGVAVCGVTQSVALGDSSMYSTLKMSAKVFGTARPLLILACFEAFWNLPPSFIKEVIDYKELPSKGNRLADLLLSASEGIIPVAEFSDEVMASIYDKRRVYHEDDACLDDVCHMEDVLAAFDKSEREELSSGIKSAKLTKSEYESFERDVRTWKV